MVGLERCRQFLASRSTDAARRAGIAIARQLQLLESTPDMGRPHPDHPELRELLIPFGDTGFVALYRFEHAENAVVMVAFRHQKEAGY